MQDRRQRRGLFQGFPNRRNSARGPCADGSEGGRRGFRAADVRHRRSGDLSGTAGDRACRGGWHLRRVGQLHDGDAEAAGLELAYSGGDDQHRWCCAAGGERAAGGGVQIRCGVAGDAQPARHLSELARRLRAGCHAVHRTVRFRWSGAGYGGRIYTLARAEWPEPREDGDACGDAAQAYAAQSARLFPRRAADLRGLLCVADGRVSFLPVRLRHPGARRGRHRADDGGSGAGPEAAARRTSRVTASGCTSRWRAASAASAATWRAAAVPRS